MNLTIKATVAEVTPRRSNQGKPYTDLVLEQPSFRQGEDPTHLVVTTGGAQAEQAARLAPGAKVVAEVRVSSRRRQSSQGGSFWQTEAWAFSVEPIATAQAYTEGRRGGGHYDRGEDF